MDKYDVISGIITRVDELVDARGVQKCAIAMDIVQRLSTLAKGLGDEDKAHEAEKRLLRDQLKPPPPAEGETRVGGETYTFDLEGVEDGADDDAE